MRVLAHRDTQAGPAGVGDRRRHTPGAKRVLTAEQEQEVEPALDGPAQPPMAGSGPDARGGAG